MQKRIVPILALALNSGCGIFGGNIDPCANGSPLQQDPKVATDCQACNMSPCPDEGGETGEDPGIMVTVAADDHRYAFDGISWQSVKDNIATPGGLVEIERDESACGAEGQFLDTEYEYPYYACGLNWNGSPAFDWMDNRCVACDLEGGVDQISGEDKWPMCQSASSPALMGAWRNEGEDPFSKFDDDVTCNPNDVAPADWHCAEGHVQIWMADDPWSHFPGNNWTCKCPSGNDSECQPGAVCEAGWRDGGGLLSIPKPTICTWDLGEGDANGVAPEGPVVYGLDAWEEGIELTTRHANEIGVRITPSFLLGLVPAAWNDDQRFDTTTGELTYCGDDALCDWLRLTDGDRLRFPKSTGLELLTGREMTLEVEHVDGATTKFAVSIEFDGDLSD
jgi:hypothetical protein